MTHLHSPVLLLVFNRPSTTRPVFETLRNAKPGRLYIASDGPRLDKEGEVDKVNEVRSIVQNVDWKCEIKTLFRGQNLGCKNAVSQAISWFFSYEEAGIILEDDCVADLSFFEFCHLLLQRYHNDTRIMAISGDNFQGGRKRTAYSYYYSMYPHCWGWATWKRAWEQWDGALKSWQEIREREFLNDIASGNEAFVEYWTAIFDRCHSGQIDSWAYPWNYSCWINNGLTILPNKNLVTNIGVGEDATHTKTGTSIKSESLIFPLHHPPWVIRDKRADDYMNREILGIGKMRRPFSVKRLLNRYFGGK